MAVVSISRHQATRSRLRRKVTDNLLAYAFMIGGIAWKVSNRVMWSSVVYPIIGMAMLARMASNILPVEMTTRSPL